MSRASLCGWRWFVIYRVHLSPAFARAQLFSPRAQKQRFGAPRLDGSFPEACLAREERLCLPHVFRQHLKVPNRISISLHFRQIKRHSPAWITEKQVNTFLFLHCHLPAFPPSALPWTPRSRVVGFPVPTHPGCIPTPPPLCFCSSTAHPPAASQPGKNGHSTRKPQPLHDWQPVQPPCCDPQGRRHIPSRAAWDNETGSCKQPFFFFLKLNLASKRNI